MAISLILKPLKEMIRFFISGVVIVAVLFIHARKLFKMVIPPSQYKSFVIKNDVLVKSIQMVKEKVPYTQRSKCSWGTRFSKNNTGVELFISTKCGLPINMRDTCLIIGQKWNQILSSEMG